MKNFFIILSGIFASIPGLSVLLTAIGVPDPDDKLIYTAVIEVFGCAVLGLIFLNKRYFLEIPLKKLNKLIIISLILFFFSLVLYIVLYKICAIEHDGNTQVYFPLFFNDQLSEAVKERGGKLGFIGFWSGDGSNIEIKKLANNQLLATTVIFLFLYQLVFTALTACFGLLAVRQDKID